jgi:hypothetical protein
LKNRGRRRGGRGCSRCGLSLRGRGQETTTRGGQTSSCGRDRLLVSLCTLKIETDRDELSEEGKKIGVVMVPLSLLFSL